MINSECIQFSETKKVTTNNIFDIQWSFCSFESRENDSFNSFERFSFFWQWVLIIRRLLIPNTIYIYTIIIGSSIRNNKQQTIIIIEGTYRMKYVSQLELNFLVLKYFLILEYTNWKSYHKTLNCLNSINAVSLNGIASFFLSNRIRHKPSCDFH